MEITIHKGATFLSQNVQGSCLSCVSFCQIDLENNEILSEVERVIQDSTETYMYLQTVFYSPWHDHSFLHYSYTVIGRSNHMKGMDM